MGDTASWRSFEERLARGEFPFGEILNVREDDLSGLDLEKLWYRHPFLQLFKPVQDSDGDALGPCLGDCGLLLYGPATASGDSPGQGTSIHIFSTVWTDTVCQSDVGMLRKIYLNTPPVAIVLTDFLAPCADGKEAR